MQRQDSPSRTASPLGGAESILKVDVGVQEQLVAQAGIELERVEKEDVAGALRDRLVDLAAEPEHLGRREDGGSLQDDRPAGARLRRNPRPSGAGTMTATISRPPLSDRLASTKVIAAMPVAVARAASAPSSAAIRFSNIEIVGLP